MFRVFVMVIILELENITVKFFCLKTSASSGNTIIENRKPEYI